MLTVMLKKGKCMGILGLGMQLSRAALLSRAQALNSTPSAVLFACVLKNFGGWELKMNLKQFNFKFLNPYSPLLSCDTASSS